MSSSKEFNGLRAFLWPIYRQELRLFIPMLCIFFCIGFTYNLLRCTKEALVITAPSSGAEAVPFIKVWAILPTAFLFTFILTRVSNRFSREQVFYYMMGIFVAFFALFTFVLYPNRDILHPNELADKIQAQLPVGCAGLIAVFRNWTLTVFYVFSEMWSTISMTILAWGFANDVSSINGAKRFYGLLGTSINLSSIVAGTTAAYLSQRAYSPNIPFGVDSWSQSIFLINSVVILSALLAIACFRYIHIRGDGYNSPLYQERQEEAPVKMGMRKNFSYLAKSKYLLCIAVIVLTYNISITLIEVIWKDQIKQLYPNPADFNAYMGTVMSWMGILAACVSPFIPALIQRLSWKKSAMISPIVLLSTGIAFFSFLLFKDSGLKHIASFLGTTPLTLGVFFGSLQNCFARASKYTVFDATKELAFIPLSKESKLKGKAAIDGVGSRLGKSGAALIYQAILIPIGTVALSTPFIAIILSGAIGTWILAVKSLGKQFQQLVSSSKDSMPIAKDTALDELTPVETT